MHTRLLYYKTLPFTIKEESAQQVPIQKTLFFFNGNCGGFLQKKTYPIKSHQIRKLKSFDFSFLCFLMKKPLKGQIPLNLTDFYF